MGKRRYVDKSYDPVDARDLPPLRQLEQELHKGARPIRPATTTTTPVRVARMPDSTACRVCGEPTMIAGVDLHVACTIYGSRQVK